MVGVREVVVAQVSVLDLVVDVDVVGHVRGVVSLWGLVLELALFTASTALGGVEAESIVDRVEENRTEQVCIRSSRVCEQRVGWSIVKERKKKMQPGCRA